MTRRLVALLSLVVTATACGSYGDPRPPLQLLPPAPPELSAAQRGTTAILRFQPPPATVTSTDGELVDLARVEILAMRQEYPVITAELLARGVDRERRERLAQAREAVAAAEEAAEQRRIAAERAAAIAAAEAAGEEPPVFVNDEDETADEETDGDEEEVPLTEDEILLRRVPSATRELWRDAGIASSAILETARRLDESVNALWRYLEMPTAIVDIDQLPPLPDPLVVVAAARDVARTRRYENSIDLTLFLDNAEVIASIPMEEIAQYRRGDRIEVGHDIEPPAPGPIRTRHFFALRTISTRGRESLVQRIVPLAPSAVPQPPTALRARVLNAGVLLDWEPPATDLLGERLDEDQLAYYLYRRPPAEGASATPVSESPLTTRLYLDTTMDWDERYVYEVRAIGLPPSLERERRPLPGATEQDTDLPPGAVEAPPGPRKESVGAATEPVRVEDVFAPQTVRDLVAVRAATRVTLRWDESSAADLRGYRVYRHRAPAPDLPEPAPGIVYPAAPPETADEDEETDAGTEGAEVDLDQGAAENEVEGEEEDADADEEVDEDPLRTALEEAARAAAAPPDEDGADARRRRRQRNPLLQDGWEMLTPIIISETRYIDPVAEPGVEWIYLVEAVDDSGNVSHPMTVVLEAEENP